MTMKYIRDTYGVPAQRGGRVIYTGSDGVAVRCVIKSAMSSGHLSVLSDDKLPGCRGRMRLHPTWNVEYLGSAADLASKAAAAGVTNEDMGRLRRMLGAVPEVPKRRWGLRNYFAASPDQCSSLDRLVSAGLCSKGSVFGDGFNYHATAAGCAAAGLGKAATKHALED